VALSAALRFRKAGQTGTDPFSALVQLQADVRRGYFGTLPALQAADFQALPSRARAAGALSTLPDGFYRLPVPGAVPYINRTSLTQFRLYFVLPDNNNSAADAISIHSGDSTLAANRPRLTITYFLTE
jgi:hypothetical protein